MSRWVCTSWPRSAIQIACAIAMLLHAPMLYANEEEDKANAVQAAYLYNFIKFTKWPEDQFANADAPFVVGAIGTGPVLAVFQKAIMGRQAHQRSIEIRPIVSVVAKPDETMKERETRMAMLQSDLKQCHVVFVTTQDRDMIKNAADLCRGHDILTVGTSVEMPKCGGIIGMMLDEVTKKIVFAINQEAIEQTRLKISSQLLKLARFIKTEE